MFELIVLGLILAGLVAISRAPIPRLQTKSSTQPVPTLWSARTDWHQFHKPAYLRRGIVLNDGVASSIPLRERRSPSRQVAQREVTGEAQ